MAGLIRIVELRYNWRIEGSIQDGIGEQYDVFRLGEGGVQAIFDMTPQQEEYSGTCFFDVHFENGDIVTVFNPNYIKVSKK